MLRGIFASHSGIVGERAGTLSSKLLMKGFAGTAPLLALSSGMPEEKVSDTNWSWTEDSHISGNTNVPAGASAVDTSITVADSNIYTPNSVILAEATGEHMLITAIAGNVLTVRRGFAGTTAAIIGAAGTVQLIGTAFPEGGGKPSPVWQSGESYSNYVQIFKNGWAITGTAKAVQYITGSKLARNKSQAIHYHAEDMERSFIYGRKSVTAIDGKELRTSNGLLAQIEDYGGLVESAAYGSVGGAMSTDGLMSFIRRIFDRNVKGLPNERLAYTSSIVMELIQRMVRKDTTYELTVKESEYGFDVTTISLLGNKLKFMTHPLMVENATWSHELYVFHPGLIKKRTLRPTWTQEFDAGRNTNNGIDADEGFIADECGWELKGAELHGIMKNIQTAVASA